MTRINPLVRTCCMLLSKSHYVILIPAFLLMTAFTVYAGVCCDTCVVTYKGCMSGTVHRIYNSSVGSDIVNWDPYPYGCPGPDDLVACDPEDRTRYDRTIAYCPCSCGEDVYPCTSDELITFPLPDISVVSVTTNCCDGA
jgi:hypothetical protein